MKKWIPHIFLVLITACSGQTYCPVTSDCPFDFAKPTKPLDFWTIYGFQANEQAQVSTSSHFTVSGNLGTLKTVAASAISIGSYVGGGTGHKAIMHVPQFNTWKLSDITSVSVTYKTITSSGGNIPYFNLSVDLDCTNDEDLNTLTLTQLRSRRRIIVMHTLNATATSPDSDGFTTYTATPTTSAWAIVGSPQLGLTLNPVTYGPLNTFDYATHPNACILNAPSGDGGLPRETSDTYCVTGAALPGTHLSKCSKYHTGVFINVGDSTNTGAYEFQFKSIKINNSIVIFSEARP